MLAETKQASRNNAPFVAVALGMVALWGAFLFVGPRFEDAYAPAAGDITVSQEGKYLSVSASVRSGCRYVYLRGVSWGIVDPERQVKALTPLENHVLEQSPVLRVLVVVPPGGHVRSGSKLVFKCPMLPGIDLPWSSTVPVNLKLTS